MKLFIRKIWKYFKKSQLIITRLYYINYIFKKILSNLNVIYAYAKIHFFSPLLLEIPFCFVLLSSRVEKAGTCGSPQVANLPQICLQPAAGIACHLRKICLRQAKKISPAAGIACRQVMPFWQVWADYNSALKSMVIFLTAELKKIQQGEHFGTIKS